MELQHEGAMVKNTVHQLGERLERLLSWNVPADRAFDVLARRAATVEEAVVVEVLRECHMELAGRLPQPQGAYFASKTLSA